MKLRSRLVLSTLAIALPSIAGLVLIDGVMKRADAHDRLADVVRSAFASAEARASCAADPLAWSGPLRPGAPHDPSGARPFGPSGGPQGPRGIVGPPHHPGPPPRPEWSDRGAVPEGPATAFVYDEVLDPARPDAPPIEREQVERVGREGHVALGKDPDPNRIAVLHRVGEGRGPCAFVLARGTISGARVASRIPPPQVWVGPLAVVVLTMFAAAGPIVARTRRLTEQVRRSAEGEVHLPIGVGGDDELSELASAFDESARRIRDELVERMRREQALREFIANTLHDVMTPLTVLNAQLSALRTGSAPPGVALASAIREASFLAAVLDNLAVAARLDTVEPELVRASIDLGDLVTRVVERHRPIATERGVVLEMGRPEETIEAELDMTLVERALGNLVFNAIDHNVTGGHVAVVLESGGVGRFRIRIVDDGPGVDPVELARLVERGYRGDGARTRLRTGQGLGLAIVSRVAMLHGFELTLCAPAEGGLEAELSGSTGQS